MSPSNSTKNISSRTYIASSTIFSSSSALAQYAADRPSVVAIAIVRRVDESTIEVCVPRVRTAVHGTGPVEAVRDAIDKRGVIHVASTHQE